MVSGEQVASDDGAEVVRSVDLADGRQLIVRYAGADDLVAVQALYRRLSVDDLRRRFFVGHMPLDHTTMLWLTVGERGGVGLVAEVTEVTEGDGSRLVVAEAGYSLLEDGDGELAITVDPEWRGWLGGWLLDVLAREAASRGVLNLQADVLVDNRAMLALLRHRGYAAVAHPGWKEIRLVVSTEGHTPTWPPHSGRPHLLVASPGARWPGETAAREAGFEIRTCPGAPGLERGCPALSGRPCPLLEGADAVVFDLVPGTRDNAALIETVRDREIPVVVTRAQPSSGEPRPCDSSATIIDQIVDKLGKQATEPDS